MPNCYYLRTTVEEFVEIVNECVGAEELHECGDVVWDEPAPVPCIACENVCECEHKFKYEQIQA